VVDDGGGESALTPARNVKLRHWSVAANDDVWPRKRREQLRPRDDERRPRRRRSTLRPPTQSWRRL